MRTQLTTVVLLLAAPLAAPAQTPRQVTAQDYARAESFLRAGVDSLVDGIPDRPNWLPDGRFWYRVSMGDGARFIMVDPDRRTRQPAGGEPNLEG